MILDLTSLVAITVGFVEIWKRVGLPTKLSPIFALIVAVGFNFLIKYAGVETGDLITAGIIAGLTSVGAYSGIKATGEFVAATVFKKKTK